MTSSIDEALQISFKINNLEQPMGIYVNLKVEGKPGKAGIKHQTSQSKIRSQNSLIARRTAHD
jgi:hypothetical protein